MNIQVTARGFNLTEGIKEAVNRCVSKLSRFLNEEQEVRVTLTSNRQGKHVELAFSYHGEFVKEEKVDDDLYTALELATDHVTHVLNRLADKRSTHNRDSIRYTPPELLDNEEEDFDEDESQGPQIVKRKQFDMKPMSEEEAILQMELLKHQAFMFYNSDLHAMCMLYKRKDGHYAIIEGIK